MVYEAYGPQGDRVALTGARRAEPVTKTPTVVEPRPGERAEAAFAALPDVGRSAAEELMLRLVVPGDAVDGSPDSVRVARPEECTAGMEALRPVSAAVLPAWPRLTHVAEAADRGR